MKVSLIDLDETVSHKDPALQDEFSPHLTDHLHPLFNVYFLNGDEIQPALEAIPGMASSSSAQIISPQWELARYPEGWAREIERFDEIWAPSQFVQSSLQEVVSLPVLHIPLPVEVRLDSFLPRRYFGLPESPFLFLFFFDYSSYMERKNPFAVLEAFERFCEENPGSDVRLVLKAYAPWHSPRFQDQKVELRARLEASPWGERIITLDRWMPDNEIKNLIRCCDCFLSLHRSEGFGRGLAEAMYLGKPVIGTGYSGNMDYMGPDVAHVVDYTLIPVEEGQYPFHEGQVWADPDVGQAAAYMAEVVRDREATRWMGAFASREIRVHFSYRAVGLRYENRLRSLLGKIRGNTRPFPWL
jgi:glycosyltransferase involved in cell wall biosynthesis